jgi:hypothetical protein
MITLLAVKQKIQSILQQQDMQKSLVWLDSIGDMDDLDVVKLASTQLAKIKFDLASTLKSNIDISLEIDRKIYLNVKNLTNRYLIVLKTKPELALDIYAALYAYHRQLFMAYKQFLDAYQDAKEVFELQQINLILCRQLNAIFAMAKWRYFDDQPAPVGTWQAVSKVIRQAEDLEITNQKLFLYDHFKQSTSIAGLLKHGFMLGVLNRSTYSSAEIQIVSLVLNAWATNPFIATQYQRDKYQFCINLDKDSGPDRVRRLEKSGKYRFWKTTRLIDMIESYLCAVYLQKPLTEFGLDNIAPAKVLVGLFKKLRVDWCAEGYQRQRRKESRQKQDAAVTVSYGLHAICNRLALAQEKQKLLMNENADSAIQQAAQRKNKQAPQTQFDGMFDQKWLLADESGTGIAFDLGRELNQEVEPGKLIGYFSPKDSSIFIIAEIKNLRKQPNGVYRAGLEIISKQCVSVNVARLDQDKSTEVLSGYYVDDVEVDLGNLNYFSSLLLQHNDDKKPQKTSLILPRNQYKRGGKYQLSVAGEDKMLVAGGLLMKQRDWVRVEVPA